MKIISLLTLVTLAVSPAFAAEPAPPTAVPAAGLPAVDHQVYLSELPASADLIKDAAANGLTVTRLDRTNDRVVITYTYPDGQIATMGYALLSSAGAADRVTPKPNQVKRVVAVTEPEIIYYQPRYSSRYYYGDPVSDFWLPLSVGVGIGWATSYPRYYYGGYYGHGHGYSHGYGGSYGGSHGGSHSGSRGGSYGGGHGGGGGRRH